ncbi:MAG: PaaI family thioesterase [Chloroflexi bacterium]|nr:MAG: PaaI family thioesterase [Chloroflexota bacterium]MBL1194757.1 PaaI family thioesterase [Chloroflexota bacterium]NOH12049.1 PaaI family thioesterase [Chloroflexota bacterium]
MTQTLIPIQDQYMDVRATCFGCGRLNKDGLQIKSYWDGKELVAQYTPADHHIGHPGYMNGGIIATLIDCHSVGLAMAEAHNAEEREIGSAPLITYVTGTLKVSYHKPTPVTKGPVELRAHMVNKKGRKTWVACSLFADGIETVKGEVLAVRIEDIP